MQLFIQTCDYVSVRINYGKRYKLDAIRNPSYSIYLLETLIYISIRN